MIGSSRVRGSARQRRASAQARLAGQHPVEHAPGRAARASTSRCACSASAATRDLVAGVAQVDRDQLGDRRFVFDDQDAAHRACTGLSATIDLDRLDRVVAHVGALDDVDDLLGQVLRVVADALDRLGDEHQVDARRDRARVFHHVGDQLAHQAVELLVDLVVLLQHLERRARRRGARRRRAPCAAARPPARIRRPGRSPAGASRLDTPVLIRRCTVRAMRAASSPTRSRLAMVLEIAISRRRSRAVGWRRAMMVDRSRSISTSIALTRSSAASTCAASRR